jgi:uncharacterized protein involved in exopolysaccharide biosynthesis
MELPREAPSEVASEAVQDDEISVLDLLLVLATHKSLILGLPAAVAVVAVIASLLMTNIYTGSTRLLPPQQAQSSASALLGQLTGGGGGVASALGLKNPNDLYVGMLKSQRVVDRLIERFKLVELYEAKFAVDARNALAANSRISSSKDGLITIEVDDEDPQRAADIANAYVEELSTLMKTLAVTEAAQRRLFFEHELRTE